MIKWIKEWIMDHLRVVYIVEFKDDNGQMRNLDVSNSVHFAEAICEKYAFLNPIMRRDLLYVRSKYTTFDPIICRDFKEKLK